MRLKTVRGPIRSIRLACVQYCNVLQIDSFAVTFYYTYHLMLFICIHTLLIRVYFSKTEETEKYNKCRFLSAVSAAAAVFLIKKKPFSVVVTAFAFRFER